MEYGARTDVGRVRENNEDSFRLAPEMNLFVLSDGMGGLSCGEIASRMATEAIISHCHEAQANPSLALIGPAIEGASVASNRLASAVRFANRAIRKAAKENDFRSRMGATIVAAWLADGRLSLAHVGDSRAYCFSDGRLEQLTNDHSFVAEQVRQGMLASEEAGRSTLQNVLLRALGIDEEVDVEVDEFLLGEEDAILLCSDGLTHELSDAQIAAVLEESDEAQEAADRLVELANQAGGDDNITVIVMRMTPRSAGAFARIGRLLGIS
jgi:PPM family protein phosphatase